MPKKKRGISFTRLGASCFWNIEPPFELPTFTASHNSIYFGHHGPDTKKRAGSHSASESSSNSTTTLSVPTSDHIPSTVIAPKREHQTKTAGQPLLDKGKQVEVPVAANDDTANRWSDGTFGNYPAAATHQSSSEKTDSASNAIFKLPFHAVIRQAVSFPRLFAHNAFILVAHGIVWCRGDASTSPSVMGVPFVSAPSL